MTTTAQLFRRTAPIGMTEAAQLLGVTRDAARKRPQRMGLAYRVRDVA
jgi:hypothetical protein